MKMKNRVVKNDQSRRMKKYVNRTFFSNLIAVCFIHTLALANPVDPQVVNGQATFNKQGNVFTITNTPGAIIHWQNFSIDTKEVTRFVQQNANSAVLNRIVGQDPSQILGALQSNGRVFLINPNGIVFGHDAKVDVNGLVASSLNLSNADFLAGKQHFLAGDTAGKVDNQGTITTPNGGQVYLIAPNVENSGIITTPKGDVVLAAGHSVQLVDSANPDLHVVVSTAEDQTINLGQVIAHGGRIGIYGALVNQRGLVNADSAVVGENGNIVFKASKDILLETGSVTSATGTGTGGDIKVLGERVNLTGDTTIDASGQRGGGSVLIGGDYQGKNTTIQNARQSYVGIDTQIKADALQTGNGGKVIVWSDDATRFYGSIFARGGALSGNGGSVETSGHFLDAGGYVDTRAMNGKTGNWLLDPTNIYIAATLANATTAGMVGIDSSADGSGPTLFQAGGVAQSWLSTTKLQTALTSSNVTVQTTNGAAPAPSVGDITVVDPISWSSAQTLNLTADGNIAVNAPITAASGTLVLFNNIGSGNITQTAPISTSQLFAYSTSGTVTLNNAGNAVTTLAGWAGLSGTGFQFTNAAPLTISTVNGSFGVKTNNKQIAITTTVGNLTVADGTYGVDAGTSNISLKATGIGGKVLDAGSGRIRGNNLFVTADSSIQLIKDVVVNALSVSQTATVASAPLTLINNGALVINSVSQASPAAGSNVDIETTGANTLTLAGPITLGNATSILKLKAGASGDLFGNGLLTANFFQLQPDSSGKIGSAATKLNTSSIGAAIANFTIGQTGGPGGVYINHTGDAAFSSSFTLMPNTPVAILASGNLTIGTNIATGTSNLDLSFGTAKTLTNTGTLSGSTVTLTGGSINSPSGVITATNLGVGTTGNVDLSASSNSVTNFAAQTGGGNLTFTDSSSLNVGSVAAIVGVTSGGGSVVLKSSAGSVIPTGVINAGTGAVTLNAFSGAISGAGNISGSTLSLTAYSGIGPLNTTVSSLAATNAMANPIDITNAGTLTVTNIVNSAPGGNVTVFNSGPLVISGTGVTASGSGAISLTAAGGFTTSLNQTASVTTGSGGILLRADGPITGAGTATTSGVVTNLPFWHGTPPPTLAACIASPTLAGCAAVLPSIATCTSTPSALGCSVILPTIATCTATPSTPGCSAVLPTIAICTVTPSTAGCSVVLPTLVTCTSVPTTPGCSAVLPTLAACITTPSAPGCTVVLPTIATCTATPSTSGCSVVLPTIAVCTLTPSTLGCSAVLPTLAACIATPSTPGCSVVLPTIAICTAAPSTLGCSAVLPTLAVCIATPTAAGCSVVLPTLAVCIATPATSGCSVVLPTIATCTATPTASGCNVVLPTLSACTSKPSLPGCSVVLPTLAQCVSIPTLSGCTVVLPSVSACAATPTQAGCEAVLPSTKINTDSSFIQALNSTLDIINTSIPISIPTVAALTTIGKSADSGTKDKQGDNIGKSANAGTDSGAAGTEDNKGANGWGTTGAKADNATPKMYCN